MNISWKFYIDISTCCNSQPQLNDRGAITAKRVSLLLPTIFLSFKTSRVLNKFFAKKSILSEHIISPFLVYNDPCQISLIQLGLSKHILWSYPAYIDASLRILRIWSQCAQCTECWIILYANAGNGIHYWSTLSSATIREAYI